MNSESNGKLLSNQIKEYLSDHVTFFLEKNLNENVQHRSFNETFKDYLEMAENINDILLNYGDLTFKQKFDYCNSQRYFIKLFLKHFLSKFGHEKAKS